MKVIIEPAWTLHEAIDAAYAAYRGFGVTSSGYRLSVIRSWANLVGRRRATRELGDLISQQGSEGAAARHLGVSASTFKRLHQHFHAVPDHSIVLPGAPSTEALDTLTYLASIGSGAAGQVWKAIDSLGRQVAVKFMYPDDSEASSLAVEQATLLARTGGHANLVQIYYCRILPHPLHHTRQVGIVMEYIEGVSLRERLRRALSVEEALTIGCAVADALTYIHAQGLVHGDLHADNILIGVTGNVKVIDLLNVRGLTALTSGHRRRGSTGDVEDLKAFLLDMASNAGLDPATIRDDLALQSARTAADVRTLFSMVVKQSRPAGVPAPMAPLGFEVIQSWSRIERMFRNAAVGSGLLPGGPTMRVIDVVARDRKLPSSMLARLEVLRKARNEAAHALGPNVGNYGLTIEAVRNLEIQVDEMLGGEAD